MFTLRQPFGHYVVGCADYEYNIPVDQLKSFEKDLLNKNCLSDDGNEVNLLFRVFYPAEVNASGQAITTMGIKAKQSHWIPHWKYAQGYAKYVGMNRFMSNVVFPAILGPKKISAFDYAKLNEGGHADEPLPKGAGREEMVMGVFPVILFSHGLSGHRTTYSAVAAELAAAGFVVACIEHRDGTASTTSRDAMSNFISFYFYKVTNDDEVDYRFRNKQNLHRRLEMSLLLDILENWNKHGKAPGGVENVFTDNPIKPMEFKGRLDTKVVVAAGHSFGASTALETLYRDSRISGVFCLDAWLFPLSRAMIKEGPVNGSLLFLHNELFPWKKLTAKRRLGSHARKAGHESFLYELLDSGHQNQSDFPLFPHLGWSMKKSGMAGPAEAWELMDVGNELCLQFLRRQILIPRGIQPAPMPDDPNSHPLLDEVKDHRLLNRQIPYIEEWNESEEGKAEARRKAAQQKQNDGEQT
eukprot:Clim_evm39s99 gene=Clim_evmTU39s99